MCRSSVGWVFVCLATVALLSAPSPAAAQALCYDGGCGPWASCDQYCEDYQGFPRTCGDFGNCAAPCEWTCGSGAHCSTYCDDNGAIKTCQQYGSCDPATCQSQWVEFHRTPPFNFYEKDYWFYSELWGDQIIYEQDVTCGRGQRERCDPFLVGKCYFADCCESYAPVHTGCWPGHSLCR